MGRDGAKRISRPPRSTAPAPLRDRAGRPKGTDRSPRLQPDLPAEDREGSVPLRAPFAARQPMRSGIRRSTPFIRCACAGQHLRPSSGRGVGSPPPEPERSVAQDPARQMITPAGLVAGTQPGHTMNRSPLRWRIRRDSNSRPLPSESRGLSQPPSKWGLVGRNSETTVCHAFGIPSRSGGNDFQRPRGNQGYRHFHNFHPTGHRPALDMVGRPRPGARLPSYSGAITTFPKWPRPSKCR